MTPPRMFENRTNYGGAGKYWEARVEPVTVSGKEVYDFIVRFGKLGAPGQTRKKSFRWATAAEGEMYTKVKEKIGKGYKEIFIYCKHCFMQENEHVDIGGRKKCLFDHTEYEVWKPRRV